MMSDYVVAPEVAEEEFDRFCEAMDLDVDTSAMDEEERKSLDDIRRTLVKRICDGSLVINEDGEPVYTPKGVEGSAITFYEPKGSTIMAMDTKKKGQEAAKMNAIMASMTKQPEKRFAEMRMRDYKVCQKIVMLFFG